MALMIARLDIPYKVCNRRCFIIRHAHLDMFFITFAAKLKSPQGPNYHSK
jgi:hypothetical protein